MRRGPARVSLESSANLSLHQRFSQVRAEQTMRTNMAAAPESVLLLAGSTSSFNLQACSVLQVGAPCASPAVATPPTGRASVWTRLGWRQLGYWTFRNKYGWRAGCRRAAFRRAGAHATTLHVCAVAGAFQSKAAGTALCVSRAGSSGRPARRRPAASATFRKVPPGGTPPGTARLFRRGGPRGRSRDVPTKTELDAELDSYMARSKTRLDAELDQYMSRSKSRLDAQLEEYMALAGQPLPWWD
ncbi:chromatin target of PRMT1b isoform X1 [Phycodurus eques]|uniref:chromatin target of PRMT1b isoform X1 n=1 Tax=Phycodurus eques TaxID=693459 RepID=UPI002ACDA6DB|nr:chromatin target of PRMT1b isoform X1 [Phycodurus eques]XP_061552722.1 chromatin target of PRMT1b isoform X1 [Phycodurus eques]